MKKTSVAVALTVIALLVAACGKGDDVGVVEGAGSVVEGSSGVDVTVAGGDVAAVEVTKADGVGASAKPAASVVEDGDSEVEAGVEEDAVAVRAEASLPSYVYGLVTLEEHVLTSDVVARVRLRTMEANARPFDTLYLPYVVITFDVLEALQGSPGGTAVVELLAGELCCHEEEGAALEAGRQFIAGRDTSWDANEAVVFLWNIARSTYTTEEGRPDSVEYVFADNGYAGWTEDHYSVFSESSRAWLPAMAASGDGAQSFYVDDPANAETITLAEVKKRMATANAMVDSSIEGHGECVLAKLWEQRDGRPKMPEFLAERSVELASGEPADRVIYSYRTGGRSSLYPKYVVDGPDGRWFTSEIVDEDADPQNNYGVVYKQVRPLAGGEYVFHHGIQLPEFFPCGYFPTTRVKYTVTVTAPAGTLHELFFDPVTVGSAVSADGTNGILKPTAFTTSNGASATVESISYESGTVRVKVVPWSSLSGHVLDFIELDGRVSLSLSVTNSTFHSAGNEFVWPVGSQPWEDGDKLMVRIRRGFAAIASPPASVTATASGGESVNLSWDAGRGAAGYQVQRRESGVETWEVEDNSVTERSYVVSGISLRDKL